MTCESQSKEPVRSGSDRRPLAEAGVDDALVWALVDAAPDAMVVIDDVGQIQLVNSQTEVMFGYPRADLLGQPVEMLVPEQARAAHLGHRNRYRADPEPRPMGVGQSLQGRRADGTEFPVEISLSPVVDGDRRWIVAAVRDVTNRLEAERHASAVRYAIDTAVDGVVIAEANTLELTYVNRRTAEILGYTADELIGMTPVAISPNLTRARLDEILSPILSDETESATAQLDVVRKDGASVPLEIHINHPPASEPGGARPIVAILRDITERLSIENEVRASEAAFRAAFDAAPVGMAITATDQAGTRPLLQVNAALCESLGYTQAELLNKSVTEITHPDDRASDDLAIEQLITGARAVYTTEKRYIRADGSELWAWLHSTPLVDGHGMRTRLLAHIVDLTDKKASEAAGQREQRRIEGLAEVRDAALSDGNVQEILELVCRHARRLAGADTAFVARLDEVGDVMLPFVFDRVDTEALVPEELIVDKPLRETLERGKSFVSGEVPGDGRIDSTNRDRTASADSIGSAMVVPIAPVDRARLLLFLGANRQWAFRDDDVATVETFATEAATALQLSEARRQQSRIQMLEDRERLARDLHDVVIQQLFGAGMGLQAVQPLAGDERVAERIGDTVRVLDETIVELRTAIFNLHSPPSPEVQERIVAIVDRAMDRLGFAPTLTIDGDPQAIPGPVLDQLLPTLTEALSNAARHADATEVHVSITIADFVQLVVTDNGIGLDPQAPRGDGLDNIEARARALGGNAEVGNNPEGGTVLTWTAVVAS